MLQLKNITKDYIAGDSIVNALKGIDVKFRKSEFVSILGASGCGKTTLLNIIGGLDRYTTGDLIIDGKSTKKYKDGDWDIYRNQSVGFIFQNYNLIPHQTVLNNVELALTISGISREERKKRAIKVLTEVGLEEQIYKKPNQLSGGQMQRVAIARALINNPEILLADEPTGALDSKTSIQIMEILKEIAKDRLIIMVTHNPDLAETYSTRIIKILDGKIIDDSNSYEDEEKENNTNEKKHKVSINLRTALHLSLTNLMTKKTRTFLTAFAGSIGIIGIALIMSVSNGFQNYIDKVQQDTLSSYPITLEAATIDMTSMMETLMNENNKENVEYEDGKITSNNIMTDLMSSMSATVETNNLKAFKEYLDNSENSVKEKTNGIQYSYNLDLNIYKEDEDNEFTQVCPTTLFEEMGLTTTAMASNASYDSNPAMAETEIWEEMIDNQELLESQYDMVTGKWPTSFNEVVLLIDENNQISDYALYALGLKNKEELIEKINSIQSGKKLEEDEIISYTYDDFLKLKYKLLLNTAYYEKENDNWIDKSNNKEYMKNSLNDAVEIKIVGIIKPKEESVANQVTGAVGYTKELTNYVINEINKAEIVKEQKENEKINIFTGLEFPEKTATSKEFDYSILTNEQKTYMSSLSEEELSMYMSKYTENSTSTYEGNLIMLGAVNLEEPTRINIYPKDFESKDSIKQEIEKYNQSKRDNNEEENVISYTDYVGLLMNSVTSIIDIISSVLIAFVSISLIVSSIMIGIITYISVLERTKEIGILRSIGASKKDISKIFKAETFIEGFASGAIGIAITFLLNIPINIILKNLTDVSSISVLPLNGAIMLVVISVVLTLIAGLIPSKLAAKKDPVVALRTE